MRRVADLDGEKLIVSVKVAAFDLSRALAGGDGDGEGARDILSALTPGQLRALALLALDCADPAKIRETCGRAHQAAGMRRARMAETAHRHEEYAHLRDNGVSPELAAPRVGLSNVTSLREYEAWYQQQRTGREVA